MPKPTSSTNDDRQYKIRTPEQAEEIMQALSWLSTIEDPGEFETVDSAVMAFFTSTNCESCKRIVKALQTSLLTDEAIHLLVMQEAESRNGDDLEMETLFHTFRTLLDDCRNNGIDAAFTRASGQDPDQFGWE